MTREQSEVWCRSPLRLGIELGDLAALLGFLDEIEVASLRGHKRIFLDLSTLRFVSRGACLMLVAQIDRCNARQPKAIGGLNPESRSVCQRLHDFGFYQHLQFSGPGEAVDEERRVSISVRSGVGATEDLSRQLEEVASLALPLFGDIDIVEAVHETLNEAVTNIVGHAYSKELGPGLSRQAVEKHLPWLSTFTASERPIWDGKWWFGGYANYERRELSLFALDHGHSVPTVAPTTMAQALVDFWRLKEPQNKIKPEDRTEREILEGVARARRSGVGTGRRGKGFPTMISLVENPTSCGKVRVISGSALYEFEKRHPLAVPREQSYDLSKAFGGTLIEWRLSSPEASRPES